MIAADPVTLSPTAVFYLGTVTVWLGVFWPWLRRELGWLGKPSLGEMPSGWRAKK